MSLYFQIGIAMLWLFFILELFTLIHVLAHKKLGVAIWAIARITPLLLVTLGAL